MEQKVIMFHGNYVSSVTERGAKTCKTRYIKLCSAAELKLAWNHFVSVSFNLQSPAIHQRPVEEPEILLKAEDTGCSKRILGGMENTKAQQTALKRVHFNQTKQIRSENWVMNLHKELCICSVDVHITCSSFVSSNFMHFTPSGIKHNRKSKIESL